MSRWKQVASALFSIGLVIAVTWYFLPQFTSVADIKSSIDAMTTTELVVLGIAALWNLVTYTFVMVTTMPDEAALGKVSRTIPTKFLSVSLKEANLILENHRYLGGLEAGKPRIRQCIALEQP